jgi:ATP-binding cassette subfamily B protein
VQGISDHTQQTQQTPHFRIHYTSGSFAGQHLPLVAERLEKAYRFLADLLGVDEAQSSLIDVYLSEMMVGPQMMGSGGYANIGTTEIHEVYRADAPGHNLERSLLEVLLSKTVGTVHPLPPLIVEALLTYITQRLDDSLPDPKAMTELATAKAKRTLPPVVSFFSATTTQDQAINSLAAASFVQFLIRTYGEPRFQLFLRSLPTQTADQASHGTYHRSLSQLEKAWSRTLKDTQAGGIFRFFTLITPYLRPYWLQVIEVIFYLACYVTYGIGLAIAEGLVLNVVSMHRGIQPLIVIMSILVVSFLITSLMLLRESYAVAYISQSVLRTLRLQIFKLIQYLHPGFFQTIQTGDIISRMTNDLNQIENAIRSVITQGIVLILTFVAAAIAIFIIDWKLALLAIIATPLFFVSGRYFGPATARASRERQRNVAQTTSTLQENLGVQAVVKAFGLEDEVIRDFTDNLNTLFRSSLRLTFLAGLYGLSANTLASTIQLAVLGIGGYLVLGNELSVGILVSFLALVNQIIEPVQGISGIIQSLQQATGALERVDELLKEKPAIQDIANARQLQRLSRSIRLEHVVFSYSDGKPTLRNLDMSIPAGANVALVGPSGSGKSTILNLLMRFYDPEQGHVIFDDVDLREATLASIRTQMATVFQDNVLFNTTIRENIRLGRLDASDAEVEAAAKEAEIHDFILSMPEGYETFVGERGSRLSGGQRQRMAIARAIIRNPAILLLDEATSALDSRTEAAINATLSRVGRGRTTISVTHRLASVVNADRIYVFDQGTLMEQGTHSELLQREGLYAQLWREQGGTTSKAPSADAEVSRLQRVPLFTGLDPQLLIATAKRLTLEHFEEGEIIINQGEIGDKLYLIAQGQVEVFGSDPSGRQRLLTVLGVGDYFGEMALMWDIPRSATVRARTPVQLYSLHKTDFDTLVATVPGLRGRLEQRIIQRSQMSTRGQTQIRNIAN